MRTSCLPLPGLGLPLNITLVRINCEANQKGLPASTMSDSQNRYTRLFLFQCEFFVSFPITQATPTSLTSSHSALFTDRQPTRKLCDMSYCYGRWYGKKDKYRLPIDEVRTSMPVYAVTELTSSTQRRRPIG